MDFNRWIIWTFVWSMCSHPFVACIPWNHPQIWQNYVSPRSNNLFFSSTFLSEIEFRKSFFFSWTGCPNYAENVTLCICISSLLIFHSIPRMSFGTPKLWLMSLSRFAHRLLARFRRCDCFQVSFRFCVDGIWASRRHEIGPAEKKESFCEPIKLASLFLRGPTSGILVR